MTNNNENEATGTNEMSEEVAHKIGVEMGHFRMKTVTINRQHLLTLEEYIAQLERMVTEVIGQGSGIPCEDLYISAQNQVFDKAFKQATDKVMNQ